MTEDLTLGLRFDEPDELREALQPLFPGVRTPPTKGCGFRVRIRAWSLGGESFIRWGSTNASAVFEEGRSYGAFTIPLFSSFRTRVGSQSHDFPYRWIHTLPPDVGGSIEPQNDAHVLGFIVDWARFTKHLRAAAGAGNAVGPVSFPPVSTRSKLGSHLLSYLDRLCKELNKSGSLVHDDRVAREVVDTLGCLLAEVVHARPESRQEQPDEAMVRLAEEFLAEDLESPVSLSDAVIVAGTSTRSLLRAFRKSRGASPMAFRRRRRLEAARRDLFFADCSEISVTGVANRYCFDHLGRFAIEYRALFGELPSETLRK